jgi:hypothetical protein
MPFCHYCCVDNVLCIFFLFCQAASVVMIAFWYIQLMRKKSETTQDFPEIPRWQYIFVFSWLVWGVVVSFSRLFDHRHHLVDVLIGMLVGSIVASLTVFFNRKVVFWIADAAEEVYAADEGEIASAAAAASVAGAIGLASPASRQGGA